MPFKATVVAAFEEYAEQEMPDWKFFKVGKFKTKPFQNTQITLGLSWFFKGIGGNTGKAYISPYVYIKNNHVSKAAQNIFGKGADTDAYSLHTSYKGTTFYKAKSLLEDCPNHRGLLAFDMHDHIVKDIMDICLARLYSDFDLRSEKHLLTNLKEVKPKEKIEPIMPKLYSSRSAIYCITRIMTGHKNAAQDYLEKHHNDLSKSEQRTLNAVHDQRENIPVIYPQ